MWRGELWFSTAMLMALGFLFTFLIGASPASTWPVPRWTSSTHDTYFVVAHFHSIVMALVLAGMGGLYYWGPKFTGYLLNEKFGKIQFWFLFIGTQGLHLPAVHPRARRHAAPGGDLSALAAVEIAQ